MAEAAKKKIRLYKFAAEYNLATDSLIDYLKEKGFNIKSKMTILDDKMLADIYSSKFKKDIEKAEKHYHKLDEFQKKRASKKDKTADEAPKEETKEEEPKVEKAPEPEAQAETAEPETAAEPEIETVIAETEIKAQELPEEEKPAEEPPAVPEIEEKPQEAIQAETEKETAEEKVSDETKTEKEEIVEQEESPAESAETDISETYKTQAELEIEKNKNGLVVLGKMELEPEGKKRKPESSKNAKNKSASSGRGKKKTENKTEKQDEKHKPKVEGSPETTKHKKLKVKKRKKNLSDEEAPKKSKYRKKLLVDKKEVDKAIKQTLLGLESNTGVVDRASLRKKKKKEKSIQAEIAAEEKELSKTKLKVTEFIAINELANLMDIQVNEVLQKCFELGMMVSINQRLDLDSITLVADEFGFEVEIQEEYTAEALEDVEDSPESLKPRPPVVTIMGHVDHGKTSLLDYIRRTNVVAGESGGITQHIGAYQVTLDGGKQITFLDTPGHEAFTAMRARGASVTDIVVLVIAADDAVMPQTIEAINHSQAAGVPMIIAINKIDKPGANVDKIRQQLADRNILVEEWGGKYQTVEVSAKQGLNIDELLEKILLEAEMLELKANPDRLARGTIIESQLDKGRGITATVLIQKGTLKIQDSFVAGVHHGRVRAMFDERNKPIKEAGPADPLLLLGFEGAPQAGDSFIVVESEREAREISIKRRQLKREQEHRQVHLITLDEIANQIATGEVKNLPLVVKGDVDGSVEALADSLMKLSNDEVKVDVIHKGVGGISESDVLLAHASNAIIVGFHVRPYTNARKLAEKEKVDIRLYNVIYDAINEVKSALEGMLAPLIHEELTATIEVRETYKVPKIGTVAGCYVQEGKISRNDKIRLFRDGINIYEGELSSLKRFKDDVKEVDAGYECGLNINNFNDIKIGDVIEGYKFIETAKKLSD